MINGSATIRKREVAETVSRDAPELLDRYDQMQILLKVRTEKRAFDRKKKT